MNLAFLRRVASTRLFYCCLLLGASPLGANAQGTAAPAIADENQPTEAAKEELENANAANAPARFGIVLNAPKALQAFLLRHLDLQRYRTLGDLDSSELDRLLLAAPDNLRDLLGTQGYFSPVIKVSRKAAEAATSPKAPVAPLGEVLIDVEPGQVTEIASSNIYFQGDIVNAPVAAEQRAEMQSASRESVGKPFSQGSWDQAKADTLRLLTNQRYPRGRIVNSLSDVDSVNQKANWYIELDSGPSVQTGEVRVEGAERYGTTTAERLVRLAGLRPGTDYSLSKLQDAQQKIADSGYYSSVFAYVDLDQEGPERDSAAPVVVQVKEALPQKVVLGVGGSTDSGPRLSIEHSHLQLPLIGWRANSKLQLQTEDQLISTDWVAPIEDDGWHWLASGRIASEVDDTTTTSGLRLSMGKAQESAELDRRYFLQYDRARTVNSTSALASSDGNEAALTANYGWTWRRFDNVPFPDSGYGFGLTLGAGVTLGSARDPFTTTHARWLGYWPLGEALDTSLLAGLRRGELRPPESRSANGRLALRLEGAAVLAKDSAPIPDTQLFLTGGDTTVRGYGLRDIGVEESDGSVTAGRYLAVASFEWQRPIYSDGKRSDWESVVFVDAGAVADKPSNLTAKVGVGVGARYNSPVGPLQIDLAYGVATKKLRVHLNVGFTF
jgi:translocation and assembly module TamA